MTTLYYDPVLDVHHRLPAAAALTTAYYAAPQVPDDARRLFEGAVTSAGWDGEIGALAPGRGAGSSLVLAREWEMHDLADRLAAAIEAHYQPTWDLGRREFTWGLGLDEPHPRGQFNAFLAAAEAGGPGRWAALSAAPLEPCPQVVDVDFPRLALQRAEWVDGHLHLRLAPAHEEPRTFTSFRIVGAETRVWDVITDIDGVSLDVRTAAIDVRVPLVAGDIELGRGGY